MQIDRKWIKSAVVVFNPDETVQSVDIIDTVECSNMPGNASLAFNRRADVAELTALLQIADGATAGEVVKLREENRALHALVESLKAAEGKASDVKAEAVVRG